MTRCNDELGATMTRRRLGTARRRRRLGTGCRGDAVLVPRWSPTPSGSLLLSSIDNDDKTTAVRVSINFIQVFPSVSAEAVEDQAASVVHYNPVAGRITKPVVGEPEIDSTGEGVWFIEAEVSYTACVDSVLTTDGTVEIEGERLPFSPPIPSSLPPPLAPPRPHQPPPLPPLPAYSARCAPLLL
ncbi:hypothetical protein OsI_30802 [Oryza sativa Indica Group]|uniref:Uncharacterized protein n=1 Tax=Oryza sativa subsp. indica TaxID=39946 RepID=A2YZM2_ORYSI|nr:hypothetical protein OsI_30802 [Oryza sativa Indica Group]